MTAAHVDTLTIAFFGARLADLAALAGIARWFAIAGGAADIAAAAAVFQVRVDVDTSQATAFEPCLTREIAQPILAEWNGIGRHLTGRTAHATVIGVRLQVDTTSAAICLPVGATRHTAAIGTNAVSAAVAAFSAVFGVAVDLDAFAITPGVSIVAFDATFALTATGSAMIHCWTLDVASAAMIHTGLAVNAVAITTREPLQAGEVARSGLTQGKTIARRATPLQALSAVLFAALQVDAGACAIRCVVGAGRFALAVVTDLTVIADRSAGTAIEGVRRGVNTAVVALRQLGPTGEVLGLRDEIGAVPACRFVARQQRAAEDDQHDRRSPCSRFHCLSNYLVL